MSCGSRLQQSSNVRVALLAQLKACRSSRDLERGRRIHANAVEAGVELDLYLANSLVSMYSKCGSMVEAQRVFDRILHHDLVSQNALILGYAENGQGRRALEIFFRMQELHLPNSRTFVAAVKACTTLAANEEATQIDGQFLKVESLQTGMNIHSQAESLGCDSNIYVANSLINMYGKCGSLMNGRRVFDRMPQRDLVSWTALMLGYTENGEAEMALALYERMQPDSAPDTMTFVAALNACAGLAAKEEGKEFHGKAIRLEALAKGMAIHSQAQKHGYDSSSIFVANSLINMYAKCGDLADACKVFDNMQYHDLVSWNSLMLGYAEDRQGEKALGLFDRMRYAGCVPDVLTFIVALKACSSMAVNEVGKRKQVDGRLVKMQSLERGMAIHFQAAELGYDSDILMTNALIDMYAKCGSMVDARKIFDRMPVHNIVSWTALILGYAENGEGHAALELFGRARSKDCDARVFAAVLKACGNVVALEITKAIHGDICKRGLDKIIVLGTSLVDVYGKCGRLVDAQQVFDSLPASDPVSWTALLAGYSRLGDIKNAFRLFHRMLDEGVQPNGITFLCLFTACSHGGVVDKGKQYFNAMLPKYGIAPGIEHYHCMLDILGRANELEEAVEMVKAMPFSPNMVTWVTILGACRKWKNVVIGKLAFEALLQLDNTDHAVYTLMSNVYGSAEMWGEQAQVLEAKRRNVGDWKKAGLSWWSDPAGVMHRFWAGDPTHPQIEEIHARLKQALLKIKEHGYVANVGCVVHNISEEKEAALCGHSERLALGCALVNTAPGTTIRIAKNLRICEDCHQAIALISKVEERQIVCRDASRFHVFEDGKCLCGDYW